MRFRPQFSLRFLLIAIALIAAITAVICKWRKTWTVDKVEHLIQAEFNSQWTEKETVSWLQSKGFHTTSDKTVRYDHTWRNLIQGWLGPDDGAKSYFTLVWIEVEFKFVNGHCMGERIFLRGSTNGKEGP